LGDRPGEQTAREIGVESSKWRGREDARVSIEQCFTDFVFEFPDFLTSTEGTILAYRAELKTILT